MAEKQEIHYPEMPPRGRPRKLFDRRTAFFAVMVLAMFLVLVALQVRTAPPATPGMAVSSPPKPSPAVPVTGAWTASMQRQVAQKLAAKGLKKEAAEAFGRYLESSDIPLGERANVLYTVGKLHFELGSYEAALAAFYEAELAGAPDDIKQELGRKIVACLENLGKSFDAQSELEHRTALVKPKEEDEARAVVVARIGKEEITLGQVYDELQKLQQLEPQIAQACQTDKKKLVEFLRQYVFEMLLARKARKLGLDQQPEFRKQIEDIIDRALAQTLVSQEIQSKVKIEPSDVRNYYEANRQRYVARAQAAVSHILLKDEETAQKVLKQALEGKAFEELAKEHSLDSKTKSEGGRLKEPVVEGAEQVPGIGRAPEFAQAVFATGPGKVVAGTVKSPLGHHVVKVHSIAPARQLPFEEVQRKVLYDYQLEKSQAVMSKMIQDTLEVERVQIYDHVILGQDAVTKEKGAPTPEKGKE
jgi:peptidyl-prolyl cis-trans isomerase C